MLGFSIGPLVGGVMTHYAGWHSNFWLNVVVLVPAALMLWRRPGRGGWTRPMDWTGLVVLAVFMVTLVSGLHSLATVRSTPLAAIVELALAAFAFAVLIRAERRHRQPLVDLGVFSHRNFAVASGLVFLLMFDIMTFLLYFNSTSICLRNRRPASACPRLAPGLLSCHSRSRCSASRERLPGSPAPSACAGC